MRVGVELGRRLHEHDMHWWDAQLARIPGAAEVEGLRRRRGTRRRHGRRASRADYPFWLLTARSMQYAWGANVGMQLIKEVADNVAGPSRRDHQHRRRGAARHRRRRPGRDRDAAAQRARPRRAAPGHPARHAAADRPVRPLGDAVRQGLRRAEHELAGAHVARPTDATGSGADIVRVQRAPARRRRLAHDPLGDGRRSAPLRRLPDLHRRRAGTPTRRRPACSGGACSTWRSASTRTCSARSCRSAASTATIRRAWTCARPPRPGSAPTASSPSTTTCASAAPTAPSPAPTRRATRPTRAAFAYGKAMANETQRHDDRAARGGDQVHVLRRSHRRRHSRTG